MGLKISYLLFFLFNGCHDVLVIFFGINNITISIFQALASVALSLAFVKVKS